MGRIAASRCPGPRSVTTSHQSKRSKKLCKFKKKYIATFEDIIQILCAVILLLFLIYRPVLLVFKSLVILDVKYMTLYVLCYNSSMMYMHSVL